MSHDEMLEALKVAMARAEKAEAQRDELLVQRGHLVAALSGLMSGRVKWESAVKQADAAIARIGGAT